MIQVQQDHHRQAAKQAEARQADRTSPSGLAGLAASPSAAAQGRRLAASPSAAAQGRRRGERSQCGISRALLQRSAAEALLTAYMASGLAGSALSARGRAAVSSQRGQERERPPHGSLRSRGVGRRSSTRLRRSRRATASTMASSAEASCGRLERREASARARPVVWSTCRARGAREAAPLRLGPCWLVASAKRALEAERAFLVDAHGVARVLGVEVEGVDSAMALWGSKDGSEALRTALAAATWRGHFTRDAPRTRKMKLEKGLGGSEVAAEIIHSTTNK